MPKELTNPEIIELAKKLAEDRDSIHTRQNELNAAMEQEIFPRIDALNADNKRFFEMMNEEYGWGKWQNVDAKTLTFIPADEFQKSWYIMANPAIREKVVPEAKVEEIQSETIEPLPTELN